MKNKEFFNLNEIYFTITSDNIEINYEDEIVKTMCRNSSTDYFYDFAEWLEEEYVEPEEDEPIELSEEEIMVLCMLEQRGYVFIAWNPNCGGVWAYECYPDFKNPYDTRREHKEFRCLEDMFGELYEDKVYRIRDLLEGCEK